MYTERYLTLVQAAKLAGYSASEMLDELASRKITVVDYNRDELADEFEGIE